MTAKHAALAGLVAGCLAAPAAASAAAITANQRCYAENGSITVSGSGFTPNATVSVTGGAAPASAPTDATGSFTATVMAPPTMLRHPGAKAITLTATDDATGQALATTRVSVAKTGVDGSPASTRPHARITWHIAGFPGHHAVYGHWRFKNRTRATRRMGIPKGPCGVLTVRARQIEARTVRFGLWKVQFDFHKRFTRNAAPRATVQIRVFRRFS